MYLECMLFGIVASHKAGRDLATGGHVATERHKPRHQVVVPEHRAQRGSEELAAARWWSPRQWSA